MISIKSSPSDLALSTSYRPYGVFARSPSPIRQINVKRGQVAIKDTITENFNSAISRYILKEGLIYEDKYVSYINFFS